MKSLGTELEVAVLKLKNTAATFVNSFVNATTAARTWTIQDKDHTFAGLDDLTALASTLNPIGTIREFNVSTNPATLLGFGTWAAFGTGRVTVAIDTAQTEFDVNGETGGEKTHLLTGAENGVPAHTHPNVKDASGNSVGLNSGGTTNLSLSYSAGGSLTLIVPANTAANASSAHNNLQPYIVVYRWVRTA
jgi:hypothetical protein